MKYLVDVNLPYKTKLWQGNNFLHQVLINDEENDSNIWDYAKTNDLIIMSKDIDFSNRIINVPPPPKVILFKTGNMKFSEFNNFIENNWTKIEKEIKYHKLVIVHLDRIECIK